MKYLDFYGTPYTFRVFGEANHKTTFSFLSSLITLLLISVGSWLMGRDFLFNLNPKVLKSTPMPESSEPVYVNNLNFTFAFKIENEESEVLGDDETFAFPRFYYEVYKKDENGDLMPSFRKVYSPSPCTETEAKDNPLTGSLNLEGLSCFDMNKIKADLGTEQDLSLHGSFEEDYFSGFFLIFGNCKYKDGEIDSSSCISHAEAVKRNNAPKYISMYYPKVLFSPENYEEPVKTYYDTTSYMLNPNNSVTYRFKYSLFVLEDDKGWIFEDLKNTVLPDLGDLEKEYGFLSSEEFANGTANLAIIDLNFQRKQIKARRVFVKIQEIAAGVGGIMKLVFFLFYSANKAYNNFQIKTKLAAISSEKPVVVNENNTNKPLEQRERTKPQISLKEYVLIGFGCTKGLKYKKNMLDKVDNLLDIATFLKTNDKIYQNTGMNPKGSLFTPYPLNKTNF